MIRQVACRTLSVFILLFAIVLIIVLNFLKYSIMTARTFIQPAFTKSLLHSYKPKTGDIVMMHYLSHGMIGIPVAEHWPTHTGFVWVTPTGQSVVIECTKFSAPALPNILKETAQKERGVRIVPWVDYVNAIDNVMYLREIVSGSIDTYEVEKQVNSWAVNIDFETRIADSMTMDLTIAIGFVPVYPNFSEWCAKTAKLHELDRRKNQAFCSEFVARLLQRLNVIDREYKELYRVSPASFLKSVGVVDKLIEKSELNIRWGDDIMIVRRT
jgi:hypothetical protein